MDVEHVRSFVQSGFSLVAIRNQPECRLREPSVLAEARG
jgi:hypothetical protein